MTRSSWLLSLQDAEPAADKAGLVRFPPKSGAEGSLATMAVIQSVLLLGSQLRFFVRYMHGDLCLGPGLLPAEET